MCRLYIHTIALTHVAFQGASKLLSSGRVTFLIFEYGSAWLIHPSSNDPRVLTLKAMIDHLDLTADYECWFITPNTLIPVTGRWWTDIYECRWAVYLHDLGT